MVKYYISGIKTTYNNYTPFETKRLIVAHHTEWIHTDFCVQNNTNIIILSTYRGKSAAVERTTHLTL